jgi:hypothetical protein
MSLNFIVGKCIFWGDIIVEPQVKIENRILFKEKLLFCEYKIHKEEGQDEPSHVRLLGWAGVLESLVVSLTYKDL